MWAGLTLLALSAGVPAGIEGPRRGQGGEENVWASLRTELWELGRVDKSISEGSPK